MELLDIQQAVCEIKELIETAIKEGGVEAKNNLIKSQIPICMLHDVAKSELIKRGVSPNLIYPRLGEHKGEMKVAGFFKKKDQDICVVPKNLQPRKEALTFDGILKGVSDAYGFDYTQRTLSINVRSQLSSTAKNFDTLYERTFAEALNLHLRCRDMVLGEFYMIPVIEYDDAEAKNNKVKFKATARIQQHLEKYIYSFNAVNNRNDRIGEEYKYERVCLLIVDFDKDVPIIYNTDKELKEARLLPSQSTASIDQMNFPTFIDGLLDIYKERFGSLDCFKEGSK